jgi:hypothetical protein
MTIFNRITARLTGRQERPAAPHAPGQPQKAQRPPQAPTTLSGTIIVAEVVPQPQHIASPAPCRQAWERKRAAFYAMLPPTIDRQFPSNHARQLWKIEQSNRRWLYHHNREFYDKLKQAEGWVWE